MIALLTLTACASSGAPQRPPVPVYFDAADIPCAWERVRPIETTTTERLISEELYRQAMERLLGREGARIGADAVLADPEERRLLVVSSPSGRGGQASAFPELTLRGEAIRYTDAACG